VSAEALKRCSAQATTIISTFFFHLCTKWAHTRCPYVRV